MRLKSHFAAYCGGLCLIALLAAAPFAIAYAYDNGAPVPPDGPICRPAADVSLSEANPEAPFLAENDAAMTRMMNDMKVKPTGDIDRDFVAMMVPHHQGAIDMAIVVLRYGRNEQLKRLAQEIIVTQQQEIAAMRLAVGAPLPPSVAAPTRASAAVAMPSAQAGDNRDYQMPAK